MLSHRPSILHRPQRPPSRANEETYESQYEREQALLRAKSQRQQETRERLLRSLAPDAAAKEALWHEQHSANALLAARPGRHDAAAEPLPSPSVAPPVPLDRPWHHVTATQHVSESDEAAARRRFAEEVAAENLRLYREREAQRVAEAEARRQPVQDEWYLRGDTHRPATQLFSGDGVALQAGAHHHPAHHYQQQEAPHVHAPYVHAQYLQQQYHPPPPPQQQHYQPPQQQQHYQPPQQQQHYQPPPPQQHYQQQQQEQYPQWPAGDAQVLVVRPQTATGAAPSKLPERHYPWSWQS